MQTFAGGIDKLELRVPAGAPFRPEFAEMYADVATHPELDPFRPTKHYLRAGDLRPFGIEAILHAHCKHGEGNHKVELLDTAQHGYSGMMATVEQIFELNPERLDVMRADMCVDTRAPVKWYQEHMRAQYKQFGCEIGKVEYMQMGKREVQTIYFGKKPNCVRVYDKIAEYKAQYDRATRRRNPDRLAASMRDAGATPEEITRRLSQLDVNPDADFEVKTFEEMYGHSEGETLTRVERQMAAGRIPAPLETAADLKANAAEFDPFERLRIVQGNADVTRGDADPDDLDYGIPLSLPAVAACDSVTEYLAGVELRRRIEAQGIHHVRNWLNKHSMRNADRILRRFINFLPSDAGQEAVSTAQLYEQYRDAVTKQLAC